MEISLLDVVKQLARLEAKVDSQSAQLTKIENQTTLTNGRVRELEIVNIQENAVRKAREPISKFGWMVLASLLSLSGAVSGAGLILWLGWKR